jgi:outer membrane lipoprotein LolB
VKPPTDALTPSPQEKKIGSVQAIKAFTIKGRIAARDNNDGFSASFYWTQSSPNHFSVKLFGPMGAGSTYIKRQGQTITIKTAKETIRSQEPEQLIRQATGYPLPIQSLYYWLRGLNTKNHPFHSTLNENNWQINILQTKQVNSLTLPEKLRLQSNELTIKLKVSSWTLR